MLEAGSECLLLGERLAPITSEIGFLAVPLEVASEALYQWRWSLYAARGPVVRTPVSGALEDLIRRLLPLTVPAITRELLVSTESDWVAYFSNFRRGSDAGPPMSVLAGRLATRGVRICAVPHTLRGHGRAAHGRYGAAIIEIYGPRGTERFVSVTNDGGPWGFDQFGTPFSFENVDQYRAPRARDRFTILMLIEFAHHLGLRPFDEDFYQPESCLIEVSPVVWDVPIETYTLEEALEHF